MKNIIQRIRSYYPISDEALNALTQEMKITKFPKNTYIVRSGITDGNVYFIEEGITRSIFHYNGVDTTTWFSYEGDITFGMYSLYHNQPSVESIETLTDCTIYVISTKCLNKLYEQYIDIANWGRILHQEVNCTMSHILVNRLQMSPRERYNSFMKLFPGVINRVKLKLIAEFLGMSIYTLSRIRSQK